VIRIEGSAFYGCTSLKGFYFKGDAPIVDNYVFSGANNSSKVYYMPGTIGWDSTLGGRPTALWLQPRPLILSLPPAFGVQNDRFGFRISWATNANVVVEAATDLAQPNWTPVSTNIITMGVDPSTDGWSYLTDPDWTNHPSRFYRLREH